MGNCFSSPGRSEKSRPKPENENRRDTFYTKGNPNPPKIIEVHKKVNNGLIPQKDEIDDSFSSLPPPLLPTQNITTIVDSRPNTTEIENDDNKTIQSQNKEKQTDFDDSILPPADADVDQYLPAKIREKSSSSDESQSEPELEPEEITPNYPPPDEEAMKLIQIELQNGLDFSVKKHKEIMDRLISTNQPYTETQLKKYHMENLNIILAAYKESNKFILKLDHDEVKLLLEERCKKLQTLINKELIIYLRKHEVTVEKVTKTIKGCTQDAEQVYDELMNTFDFDSRGKKEFLEFEKDCWKAAVGKFNQLVIENGIQVEDFWQHELNYKLQEAKEGLSRRFMPPRLYSHNSESLGNTSSSSGPDSPSSPTYANVVDGPSVVTSVTTNSAYESEMGSKTKFSNSGAEAETVNATNEPSNFKDALRSQSFSNIALNIGIYMDEISMIVGTFKQHPHSQSSLIFDPFVEVHPEVVFMNDSVIIGSEASNHIGDPNHFQFYPLVVDCKAERQSRGKGQGHRRKMSNIISLKYARLSLSTEDILAAFLWTLLKKIEEMKSARIGQLIFTLPTSLSNVAKQRLRSAVRLAGFKNGLHILSTSLTTAISHQYKVSLKGQGHGQSQDQPMSMQRSSSFCISIVLHYRKRFFSIAIVEITLDKVEVKKVIDSGSQADGREGTFFKNHGHLYDNGAVSPEGSNFVSTMYKNAIQEVFAQVMEHYDQPQPAASVFDSFIIVRRAPSKIDKMIRKLIILNPSIPLNLKIVERSLVGGPLLGASAFAAKPRLPNHIKSVQDSSALKLKLFMNDAEQEFTEESFLTRSSTTVVSEGIGSALFKFKFAVANEGTLRVRIKEEIAMGMPMPMQKMLLVDACRYDLKIRCEPPQKEYLLTLICSMDPEGMYNLSVHNPWVSDVSIDVLKVENSNVPTNNHSNSDGFSQLIQFYSKSKSK